MKGPAMKNKIFRAMKQSERGQSLVELAITLIVLLYLLLGAAQFSIALFQYVTMNDAVQEGAIYASVNPTDTNGIKQRAADTASDILPLLDEEQITVSLVGDEYCEGLSDSGDPNSVQVQIAYPHKIFMPLVAPMIGTDTIHLKATTVNTILQPRCD
jgi:Flp pilus assembly protein TadG